MLVPDPASRAQADDVHDPSVVVDPRRYAWRNTAWRGRPWRETVLYELHAGILGGFRGVARELPRLAALGITAIELMPVNDFPGLRNWGYDGVLPYAPDAAYGTPDDLKALVDAAHDHGLMIFLDVVYNHFGPDGNYLLALCTAILSRRPSYAVGAAIDFRRPEVRDFFTENVLLLADGVPLRRTALRCGACDPGTGLGGRDGRHRARHRRAGTACASGARAPQRCVASRQGHAMRSGTTTGTMCCTCCYRRGSAATTSTMPISRPGNWRAASPTASSIRASNRATPASRAAMPSGHLPPTAFVLFLQNHDQIGNRAFGERLTALVEPAALEAAIALMMLCPQIPMLFMGEESASRTPFLFFTDHHAELADAVREGRRNEFAKFPAFADPASRERIPDPNAPETFAASVPHADPVLGPAREALYRRLIALRATAIVPRLDGARALTAEVIGPKAVVARWRLGDGAILTLASNLDADAVPMDLPASQPLFANAEMPLVDCRATAPALSSMSLGRPMSDEAIRDLAQPRRYRRRVARRHRKAEDRRARGAAPHARGARPALCHARRPAGQPQAVAAQIHRAGVAAADHGNGGPADTA